MLTDLLNKYIQNPGDSINNWNLALAYYQMDQTASALSYFLRTAERSDDKLLQYESLLLGAKCYDKQTTRSFTVRGMLQHAIAICPERPEAYYLLSLLCEHNDWSGKWFDAYTYASIPLKQQLFNIPPLQNDVGYPGYVGLLFQKAHAAWWTGLADESKEIFEDLWYNHHIPDFMVEPILGNLKTITGKDYRVDNDFDWGVAASNTWFKDIVDREVFQNDVYQKFRSVKEGDVVFDIGASVGPFSYKIKDSKASKIIAMEPHKKLFKTLLKNTSKINKATKTALYNTAIAAQTGKDTILGLFNESFIETHEPENLHEVDTISFTELVKLENIEQIDFLKIDCEGGEYDVFTEDNFEWIKNNVRYIVGEWHLSTLELQAKFRKFRDLYLKHFEHQVYSFDEVDIKHDLWSDWFIEYYDHVTIYIDNPKNTYVPTKWKYSISPTMEFTTIVPEKGCVVDCVFCPQRTLVNNYTGERRLSLDKFKYIVDKIPQEVRITFAGFTEPWLNSDCTDMVLYAHEKGHPVSVFTTLVGVSVDDLRRIKDIPYAGNPNGGFTVHLPDQENRAKHPITSKYLDTVEYLGSIHKDIKNFTVMSMGTVHDKIKHVFPEAPTYPMWSRAGNLIGERLLKPELKDQKFLTMDHGNKSMTCGCPERLYHNIMLPNGDVSLCCMDYSLDNIVGNLFEQDYNDAIPRPYATYDICRRCENAIDVNSKFIKAERKQFNV